MKVPILTYEGPQGGYEIDQNYFIPSIKLQEEEITILIMLLVFGKEIKIPELYKHYEMLKLRLLNAVEKNGSQRLTMFFEKFKVYINRINPCGYVEHVLQTIIKSLEEEKKVKLSYYIPLKDIVTEREVSPYKFVFEEGGWYLIAYCHMRGKKRTFRLDRIKSIQLLESKCNIPIDLALREEKNTTIKPYHLQIDRRFYDLIKNDFYMEDHRIIEESETLKIEVYTDSEDCIIELALKNPRLIRILGPQNIHDQVRSIVKDLSQLYG